jgi:hypothetical protein
MEFHLSDLLLPPLKDVPLEVYPKNFFKNTFNQKMPKIMSDKQSFTIKIQVDDIVNILTIDGKDLDQILFNKVTDDKKEIKYNDEWKPDSDLNDYEIIVHQKKEKYIDEDEGIGVIIIECAPVYIKIVKYTDDLSLFANWWDRSLRAKYLLEKDLLMGYDVLYFAGDFDHMKKYHLRYKQKKL